MTDEFDKFYELKGGNCSYCQGSGDQYINDNTWEYPSWRLGPCSVCQGTGRYYGARFKKREASKAMEKAIEAAEKADKK